MTAFFAGELLDAYVVFEGAKTRRRLPLRVSGSSRPCRSDPAESVDLESTEFLRWILDRAGHNRGSYRLKPLHRRLSSCLRVLGVGTVSEARQLLQAQPHLIDAAIDTLLIGITEFFRDASVFRQLEKLLPPSRSLMAWSVACSDGAELYSLAMLLDARDQLIHSYLQGSDIRPTAVHLARRGVFSNSHVASIPPDLLRRYLRYHSGTGWQIDENLRSSVHWRVADAMQCHDEEIWDLILCRNMAIYLETASAERLWRQLSAALRPGGILMTGKAEKPDRAAKGLHRIGPCLYRRHGG